MDGASTTMDCMTDQEDISPDIEKTPPEDTTSRELEAAKSADPSNTQTEPSADNDTKSLSQNCGTGVSPVSYHGPEARATGGLGIGSEGTAQEQWHTGTTAADTDDAPPADGDAPLAAADGPVEMQAYRIVEAILFAADTPMPPAKIAQVLGIGNARDARKHIAALNEEYARWELSFRIEEIAGGYQMLTLPAYNTWLVKLLRARQETKLSPAAMETLAIVAYKQPCTRADIEAIRGVAAGDMLNRLREMNLIKIVGRAEDLGRPLLYGTSKRFLEVFGLPSVAELPQVEALGAGTTESPRDEPADTSDEAQRDDDAAAPDDVEASDDEGVDTGDAQNPPRLAIAEAPGEGSPDDIPGNDVEADGALHADGEPGAGREQDAT